MSFSLLQGKLSGPGAVTWCIRPPAMATSPVGVGCHPDRPTSYPATREGLGTALEEGPGVWGPASPEGAPGCQPPAGPALAAVSIWEVNQQMDALYLHLTFFLSPFQNK